MSRNEKANAGHVGSNTDLKNKLTMKNNTPTQSKFQLDFNRSRRELLEKSKLSRLPELPKRTKLEIPDFAPIQAAAVCVNCGGRLDPDDNIQQSVKVCRKCLTQYATIDAAIDEASKRKRKAMLEQFTSEVNNDY
jgi:hypothetical protein